MPHPTHPIYSKLVLQRKSCSLINDTWKDKNIYIYINGTKEEEKGKNNLNERRI